MVVDSALIPALFPPTMAVLQLWATCRGRETEIDTTCGYCGNTEYSFRPYRYLLLPALRGSMACVSYHPPTALRVSNILFALCRAGVPSIPCLRCRDSVSLWGLCLQCRLFLLLVLHFHALKSWSTCPCSCSSLIHLVCHARHYGKGGEVRI